MKNAVKPFVGPLSFGAHYDPCSMQRKIGRHVYIFRLLADRLDVWRLELNDTVGGHRWTLAHTFRAVPELKAEVA